MKNLITEREISTPLDICEDGTVANFSLSTTEAKLYVITANGTVCCFDLGATLAAVWRCPLGADLLSEEDFDNLGNGVAAGNSSWVVSFSHVLELDAICIATRAGKIALLHVDEGEARHLEQVGCVDGGLSSLEWSPDGELLVALSITGNLLVMNQAWELLFEGPALGPAAAAADPTALLDPALYRDSRITWRGDGKYFAVVCRDPTVVPATAGSAAPAADAGSEPQLPPYRVRIWDRSTLEVHATGEAAEGLLPLPAWQPNGRHLYVAAASTTAEGPAAGGPSGSVGTGAEGHSILLYERNGLRHGGFNLPTSAPVSALAWSCDSELLAVVTAPQEGSDHWVVQMWHRSNWHWYLKHERRYPHSLGAAVGLAPRVQWDDQQGSVLHVVTPAGLYDQVCLAWDTCLSERGTAVVVDGRSLLLTPLRHGLVPPPMCAARAVLPEAAVDVCVGSLPAQPGAGAVAAETTSSGAPDSRSVSGPGRSPLDEGEDEVVAALTSSGRLVLLRSVEEDLWQETLEDQEALAAERGAGSAASTSTSDRSPVLLPAVPQLDVPLAGGRRARALCWLYGSSSLLVLAAPYPEPGLEDGAGDVLVQVDVEWLSYGPADPVDPRVSPEVRLREGPPVYAGGRVLRLAPHTAGGVAVQLAGGAVARFCPGATALSPCGPRAALPVPCPVVRSLPALAHSAAGRQGDLPPLLGLSRTGMLCWGNTAIAGSEVTSIAVRACGPGGPALLYTTRKNLLYTVLMSQLPSYTHRELTADPLTFRFNKREGEVQAAMHTAMRPDVATAAARDVAVRAVEAGAVLVGCPTGSPADGAGVGPGPGTGEGRLADVPVVLQMPRGNLEGVAPRALVLAALVGALRRRDYGEAWRLASVQRVDLNLLVDYGWPSFLATAADFVAAVPRPNDLCDLLFALRPGSVLAEGGAYGGALTWLGEGSAAGGQQAAPHQQQQRQQGSRAAMPQPAALGAGGGGGGGGGGGDVSKVSAVCRSVREAVLALPEAHRHLEVVVTSYARSDPPQLEAAMRCIREAKERELATAPPAAAAAAAGEPPAGAAAGDKTAAASHNSPADKALKHLLLYVDADELYGTALGMYDMPLAYMVVVNAQKDPGEYLAELQRFASISPPPLQRHAIDTSLRRYASALSHLVQAGPQYFDQALQLAREKGLLRQLLQLYDNDPEHRPAVLDAYGDQLESAKRYEDAAVSYMAAGRLEKALRAYRAAGRWRMMFVVAGQLEYDEGAVQALAADVAEELAAGGQAADAAAVLLSYLGDVDNAVRTYTQAREWREAVRVAHAHYRPDLVETVVAPAAAEGAATLLTDARESAERIIKYRQRLADVRVRRMALSAAVAADDEGGAANGVPDDLQSDVVSLVSGLSVYTDATDAGSAAPASSASASRAPSTVGGRKAHRQKKKLQKAGGRIRQGSPLEEASLVAHVHGLAPRPAALEECGQLAELLVLLGHSEDARTLQLAMAAWQEAYKEAREDMAAHPVPREGHGPARAELERLLQPAPDASEVAWKWEVLRDFSVSNAT